MKRLAILLCLLGVLSLPGAGLASLIANGDFNAATTPAMTGSYVVLLKDAVPANVLPGWTINSEAVTIQKNVGGNSSQAARLYASSTYGNSNISQAVALLSGATYQLTFDYYNHTRTGGLAPTHTLSITVGGTEVYNSHAAANDWISVTKSFVYAGPTGSTVFSLLGLGDVGAGTVGALVDNLELGMTKPPTGTPIPAAVWLMGSGLAGIMGLKRRFNSRA